jgi:integrase/recombinase XerD
MVSVSVFTTPLGEACGAETELEPVCSARRMFVRQKAIARHSSTAMVNEREAFLGYMKPSISHTVLKYYASVLCYIVCHVQPADPNAVSNHDIAQGAIEWTNKYPSVSEQQAERRRKVFRGRARCFYRFLGVYAPSRIPRAYERPFADFVHASATAGYRLTTRTINETLTRKFLNWVAVRRENLAGVLLADVDDFLFEIKEQRKKHRTIVSYCRALRAFFRFAERNGWSQQALSETIKSPVEYGREKLLNCPPWNQVRKLVKSLDCSTPELCRAKAIVLLASVYGMRCSEIANLTLDDFDWYNEVLTVRRAKRGRVQQFPIQFEVGEAIIRYLREVRGHSQYRTVFLSLNRSRRPIKSFSQALAATIRGRGVLDTPCGLHGLRHACATELLRTGTSLQGIADLLGHRNLRSVSIYAHCDIHALRRVADFPLTDVL